MKTTSVKQKSIQFSFIFATIIISQLGCRRADQSQMLLNNASSLQIEDDQELDPSTFEIHAMGCIKASAEQVSVVDFGNTKLNHFMSQCYQETDNSPWCQQVARPNPESHSIFDCTYSSSQPHSFIHPNEGTWEYAITAIKLIQELQAKGVNVSTIYNWWRPEPYNENVGGAPGRHPFGTSIDVRFATKADQEKAHRQLCIWRSQGRLRALGYYSSTALHFGIGDKIANTWGKSCP